MGGRASPRLVAGVLLGFAAIGAAPPVAAQRSNSGVAIGPSEELSHPPSRQPDSPAPRVEHLFRGRDGGDRGGGEPVKHPGERTRDRPEGRSPGH